MVRVEIVKAAQDDMRRLDRSVQAKIAKKLRYIRGAPEAVGHPLVAALRGLRSIEVGNRDWRIVWEVFSPDLVVIWAIGRRAGEEVYNEAARRIEGLPDGPKRLRLEASLPQIKLVKDETEALLKLVPEPPKAERRTRRLVTRMRRRKRGG